MQANGRRGWTAGTSRKNHSGPEDVRAYIGAEFRKLSATREFLDALPGYLLPDQASQARVSILLERLQKIAAI